MSRDRKEDAGNMKYAIGLGVGRIIIREMVTYLGEHGQYVRQGLDERYADFVR